MKLLMQSVVISFEASVPCVICAACLAKDLELQLRETLTTQVQVDEEAIGNDLEPQAVLTVNAPVQAVRDAVVNWARQREGASPVAGETVDRSATSYEIKL